MYSINAVFDGSLFTPKEPIPVEGKYEVVITFIKPIETKKQRILKYFGTWDDDDVKVIDKIIEERVNFSLNRGEV